MKIIAKLNIKIKSLLPIFRRSTKMKINNLKNSQNNIYIYALNRLRIVNLKYKFNSVKN